MNVIIPGTYVDVNVNFVNLPVKEIRGLVLLVPIFIVAVGVLLLLLCPIVYCYISDISICHST